jgi:hypothetical protein
MGFKIDQQGPTDPFAGTPPRSPGSVRRTSHLDHVRDHGPTGAARITGAARELRTTRDGAVIDGEVALEARAHAPENRLELLVAEPPDPRLEQLLGERLGGGFRARLTEVLDGDDDRSSLLHLLLDDLPGANLVSGYALQRRNAETSDELELTVERLERMIDVCAGWTMDASLMRGVSEEHMMPTPVGPVAPDLGRPDDPWAWHDMPATLPAHGMRRRRRIDLVPGDDDTTARFDAHFRDSYFSPYGALDEPAVPWEDGDDGLRVVESVLHEYTVNGVLDLASAEIRTVRTDARVLPWRECPAAVASSGRIPGMALSELRARVRNELTGAGTCTHLNDLFRSLADLEAMAPPHLRPLDGGARVTPSGDDSLLRRAVGPE